MMKVYFDNAATTSLDPEVLEAMLPYMKEHYGNPSSIHSYGRQTRSAIDNARRSIAGHLKVSPGEIFFTSGGTEANNMALQSGVNSLGIKNIISSKLEHHAVLHTLNFLERQGNLKVHWVNLKENGAIDLVHLDQLLADNEEVLVSLMYGNNEIGNLLDIQKVGELCSKHGARFHSDTVQAVGHYNLDFQSFKLDMASASAHKFHGPKSCGFLYINGENPIGPFIHGGAQERNMRGGTENVYGIIGMAKALDIALENLEKDQAYVKELKLYAISELKNNIEDLQFNGESEGDSLYTILSISLPVTDRREMLLFNLDIAGIAVSGGSACSSGVPEDSHVLTGIGADMDRPSVRISFSKLNTKAEVDYFVKTLVDVLM
ncbi:MAG: cysteine desulfurase [Flavobacteriales bacterium]|nr:cysteine desulfurase [Flavobacteriales bacterium]